MSLTHILTYLHTYLPVHIHTREALSSPCENRFRATKRGLRGSRGHEVRRTRPSDPPELSSLMSPAQEDQGGPRATPVRHRVVVRGQAPPPQRRFSRTSLTRHSSRANNKARSLPSRAFETSTPHATPPTTPPVPSPPPQDTVTPNTAAAGKVTTRQHGRSASGLLPRL